MTSPDAAATFTITSGQTQDYRSGRRGVSGGRRGSSNYAALIARNHEYLDTAEVVIAPAVGQKTINVIIYFVVILVRRCFKCVYS